MASGNLQSQMHLSSRIQKGCKSWRKFDAIPESWSCMKRPEHGPYRFHIPNLPWDISKTWGVSWRSYEQGAPPDVPGLPSLCVWVYYVCPVASPPLHLSKIPKRTGVWTIGSNGLQPKIHKRQLSCSLGKTSTLRWSACVLNRPLPHSIRCLWKYKKHLVQFIHFVVEIANWQEGSG